MNRCPRQTHVCAFVHSLEWLFQFTYPNKQTYCFVLFSSVLLIPSIFIHLVLLFISFHSIRVPHLHLFLLLLLFNFFPSSSSSFSSSFSSFCSSSVLILISFTQYFHFILLLAFIKDGKIFVCSNRLCLYFNLKAKKCEKMK